MEAATQLSNLNSTIFRTASSSQTVFLFDGQAWSAENSLSLENALNGVTHVLISVPTGASEDQVDPVLSALGETLLHATKKSVEWVGYLSTIGVYGETNGLVVDESAPVHSSVKRCQLRIKAENLWLHSGLPIHIFRIAGIYGPGRGTIARVRSGTASRIHLAGRKLNRIHVDDIVNVLVASAAQPNPRAIYNLCDDEPAPADQVTAYACELLGVDVPPLQSWEEAEKTMSAMAKSFYAESKICSNGRIKAELGVKLLYPTYREGFLAQVLEEDQPARGDITDNISDHDLQRLVVLVNMGSLQAQPCLDLRQLSFRLSRSLGRLVVPCSFQLSHQVDPQDLNGLVAKTFEMVLTDHLTIRRDSPTEVIVLPLLLGESSMLTKFLPNTIGNVWAAMTQASSAPLSVRVGGCLVDPEDVNDTRVTRILMERIQAVVELNTVEEDVRILVVDYGTPSQCVHEARDVVAQQLRGLLKTYERVKLVNTACIERGGSEYDFQGPRLVQALDHFNVKKGIVVCANLLLSNDRPAGEKGDIEDILESVRDNHASVDVRVTKALGTHKLLSEIMYDRYRAALSKEIPDYTYSPHK
ncbi:hypothetical protein PsorP6_019125 [Peronosclerospora sorghi]|nr:hypothetical protein PsorP6_019125 [Peronosclerospora sorghi]